MRNAKTVVISRLLIRLLLLALICLSVNTTVSAAETGGDAYFLTIGDIHFNPFEKAETAKKLAGVPVEAWESTLLSEEDPYYPSYGEETDFRLLESMLKFAAEKNGNPDFILCPGDILGHHFRTLYDEAVGGTVAEYGEFVLKTMRFVIGRIKHYFPAAPLIPTMGNNDSVCGDYTSAKGTAYLGDLGKIWGDAAGNLAPFRDFSYGGYYYMPHPAVKDLRIIVLNTVLWSYRYGKDCGFLQKNPGAAQMEWLSWQLYSLKQENRKALLLMHIPPGINSFSATKASVPYYGAIDTFWNPEYEKNFQALVESYPEVLEYGFAGHTHMDDFRLLYASGTPTLLTRINPAVTPLFGNNPGFVRHEYARGTGELGDYRVFRAAVPLTKTESFDPAWKAEYSFTAAYDLEALNPASFSSLAKRLIQEPGLRSEYLRYYTISSEKYPVKDDQWYFYCCSLGNPDEESYVKCLFSQTAN